MEFFTWVSLSQTITALFQSDPQDLNVYIEQCRQTYYIGVPVAVGIFLLCLILGGFGLSAMAKKEGKERTYLGFLPFANTYYAGEIAGESSFFGQKMKRAGLYAMLAEITCFVLDAFYLVGDYVSIPYYEVSRITETGTYVEANVSQMPLSIRWLAEANVYFYWLSWLFSFIELIFFCVLFMALFRKYYARRPVLMTVLCSLFPFRGFVLFSVRNNTPVDYNEYMRRKAEQFARNNPQNYGGYNGGYNGGGYNGNYNGGNNGGYNPPSGDAPSDPFGEFGGSSGSSDSSGSGGSSGSSDSGGSPFDDFN